MEKFAKQRIEFAKYMQNRQELENILTLGEKKAETIANTSLKAIREKLIF